jgi:hypothetical protein
LDILSEKPEPDQLGHVHPSADWFNAMCQYWTDTIYATVYSGAVTIVEPRSVPTIAPADAPITPGDVNNSGSIDIVDALLVAQYCVGRITGF